MFLRTLGGLYLERPDGTPAEGALGQRRLLAILAVLSAAGERGASRDRLLGLLWPDADPERSRHALTQSLYHVRRALGADDVFAATGDVRLNPDVVDSDVRQFEAARRAGALDEAAALYRGPFLDGFYLAGTAEFEQWVALERARLARSAATLFDALADRSSARGDLRAAVEWRRRHAALDPFDSPAALALMQALVAAHDPSGAVQHARVHEALVREQLGIAVAPAVRDLAERLRAGGDAAPARLAPPASAPPASAPPASAPPAPAPVPVPAAAPVAWPTLTPRSEPAPRPRRRLAGRSHGLFATLALLGMVLGVGIAHAIAQRADVPQAPQGQRIAVAPFQTTGADPALAFLKEGIVELLTLRLADGSAATSVDAGSVLAAWRRAGLLDRPDVRREDATRLAAQLGAGEVVVGSVVGTASRAVFSASVLDAHGSPLAEATVEGPVDSVTKLLDALAIRLTMARDGEEGGLAEHTTASVLALRAFLEGQRAYRRGRYMEAARAYESALADDSSFALAAFRLALAADRINAAEQHDRALALAWAARGELSARDRAHLVAFAGPRYPAPSTEAEQVAAWQRATALAPDRAELWYDAGEEYLESGRVLGMADFAARAEGAFQRALQIQPWHAPARRQLVVLAARARDTALLARYATPVALRDSLGDLAGFVRWRVALATGDAAWLARLRDSLAGLDDANLRAIAMAGEFDGDGIGDAERAVSLLRARAVRPPERLDALFAAHALALLEGRPARARALADELPELEPAHARDRLHVLDALYGDGDAAAARSSAQALASSVDAPGGADRDAQAVRLADACVLEQWRLARGDTRSTARTLALLRAPAVPDVPVAVGTAPLACAELLDATFAVVARRPDALARVRHLDSLMRSGPAIGDATNYAHLLVSRLYARLGQRGAALAAIRRRPYWSGWPRYLGTTRFEEGFLARALGDDAGSRDVLRRYAETHGAPERVLAPRAAAARSALGAR